MTDFVILGFLMLGPASGYDVRRRMAMSTAHFYRASFGRIYPALERMEREGLAKSSRSEASGRLRKEYAIRSKGRSAFLEWLASPFDIASGPSALLIRLFFLGCLPRAKARTAIEAFRDAAEARRERVSGVLEGQALEPDFFQASTRRFGMDYYGFLAAWLGKLAKETQSAGRKAGRAPRKGEEATKWKRS